MMRESRVLQPLDPAPTRCAHLVPYVDLLKWPLLY